MIATWSLLPLTSKSPADRARADLNREALGNPYLPLADRAQSCTIID